MAVRPSALSPQASAVLLVLVPLHLLLKVGLGLGASAPDLLTVSLLLVAREASPPAAGAVGLLMGIVEDAVALAAFGANALARTLVGVAGSFSREIVFSDSAIVLAAYLFVGKISTDVLAWIFGAGGERLAFVEAILMHGFVASAYVVAVGLVVARLSGLGTPSRDG